MYKICTIDAACIWKFFFRDTRNAEIFSRRIDYRIPQNILTVINTDYDRRVALHCNLPAIYFRIIPRVNQQTAAAVDIHICHADDVCICFDIRQTNETLRELLKHEKF